MHFIYKINKYTNWYYALIDRAQKRNWSKRSAPYYVERHHIVPRALGGTNMGDNLVYLTAKEHFICHLLLPKMVDGEYRHKMLCALHYMQTAHTNDMFRYTSRVYEIFKRDYVEVLKLRRGILSNFYGKRHSMKTREKISRSKVGVPGYMKTPSHRINLSKSLAGKIKGPMSESHRYMISQGVKGKKKSTVMNMSDNWVITHIDGMNIQINNLKKFCEDNNLLYQCMKDRASGKTLTPYKGYSCRKVI